MTPTPYTPHHECIGRSCPCAAPGPPCYCQLPPCYCLVLLPAGSADAAAPGPPHATASFPQSTALCYCLQGRLTLLLGPPSCGKSTFLKAVAGRVVTNEIQLVRWGGGKRGHPGLGLGVHITPSHTSMTCHITPGHTSTTCHIAPGHTSTTCHITPGHTSTTCHITPSHTSMTCHITPGHTSCHITPGHTSTT